MLFERLGKSRRRLIANAGRNPGDGVAHYRLSRVYARMGRRAEAKGILKALKPQKPDFRAAAYAALGE